MEENTERLLMEALACALRNIGKEDIKLKEYQYEAIKKIIVDNRDTVCVLPTGYGKSLIYQLLPDVFDYYLSNTMHARQTENSCSSIILVISLLNALMLDQVNKLQKYVKVYILKEDNEEHKSDKTPRNTVEKIKQPSQIIFTHPEALIGNKRIFHVLSSTSFKNRIKAIVIDESHLVKEW